jgi:hypothetical protein
MSCHSTTLKRGLVYAAYFVILTILSVIGAKASEQLSERELKQLFPGHFQAIVQGALVVSITARRDGSLLGEFMSKSDTGQWSIRSGQLCIRFSRWLNGRTSCAAVVEQAGWYQASDIKFRETERWALPVRSITR